MTFAGHSIAEINVLPFAELVAVLRPFASLPEETNEVAVRICTDLLARVEVLLDLGLGYLSLGRSSTTLSPGETQRLRIATQLRSGLFGVVYVLDEPSAGLHPADAEPLLDVLDRLKASGNSLFVVEHDLDVVRRADWVVDIGPGAGEAGGRVLYRGPVPGLEDVPDSATSAYLFGRAERLEHDVRAPQGWLRMTGVSRHNLRDVTIDIPLCVLTAVTGVSGSGKSTLVSQVLAEDPTALASFDRLVLVDQRPIGRTPQSNLATYTGMFDTVRELYAATDCTGARVRPAGSRSTSPRAAARPAKARVSSRSSCSSCPAPMLRARRATARATTPRRSRSPTATRTLRTYSPCPSTKPRHSSPMCRPPPEASRHCAT